MNNLNRILSILISFLLFFNSSLFTLIYSLKLLEIKCSANNEISFNDIIDDEKIDPENLHVLSLPLSNADCKINNLVWTDENEFILNGHYCDVVSKRIAGDTLILIYIHDNAEDELKTVYSKYIQNQDTQNHPMKYFNILFSFLTNVVLQNIYELNPPSEKFNNYFITNHTLLTLNPEIPEPPPKYHT